MNTQEVIKKYILPKKCSKKLDIFLFLLRNNQMTTTKVAKHFKISRKNLMLCLHELQSDFNEIEKSDISISTNNGTIYIHSDNIGI
ncbi:TPA: helix-turn-helix domain-containing protein, partial [Enterococcus faecalis]|nr:helix-turn-helix domain-containing protein [Enterococcus faecalis]